MLISQNPVVGGTVLRRAAIQSPNFVAGSVGWAIKQDGSAEFNNIVIRNGQVVSGTALYYAGTPALGNLVASIAASASSDSFGNAYLAGITSYSNSPFTAWNIFGAISFIYTAPAAGGPWTQVAQISQGSGDLIFTSNRHILSQNEIVGIAGLVISGGITDQVALSGALAGGDVLKVTNTTGAPTAPNLEVVSNAAGDRALGLRVAADTSTRLLVDSNGKHSWGPGNAAQDTDLYRNGVGLLKTDTELDVGGILKALAALSVVGGETADTIAVSSGQAGGNVLQVTNTTAAPTGASTHLIAAAAADRLLAGQVTGDTVTRWLVDSNGKQSWGPGGATAQDVTLQRNAGFLDETATDGNTYQTARLTLVNTGQTITSVTPTFTAITNLSAAVKSGVTYKWRLWVTYQGSAALGAPIFEMTAPAVTFSAAQLAFDTNGTSTRTQRGAGLNTAQTGPTFQTSAQLLVWEGVITPSANGTLLAEACTNTSGDNLVINGAVLELNPVA